MQTHILVIDDDPIHTKMVSYLLAEHGYTVTVLTDPRGVLDTIRQQAVDLIFMEVALPYQDGFSLCAQLRRQHPDLPIIFLSTRSTTADQVRGFAQGADLRRQAPSIVWAKLAALAEGAALASKQPTAA